MIDDETRRKPGELKLGEAVEALAAQDADPSWARAAFDDRVRALVDYVWEEKRQASVKRLIERARLRFPAAEMPDFIYEGRRIDATLVREVGTCQFVHHARNVVIEGATGAGKSFLGCCLAKQACRQRMSARYVRLPDLIMERDELAATERTDRKILNKYARPELLVVDEWLTQDVDGVTVKFLFELIERRYAQKSTVLCTQYTPAEWHGRLGGGVCADAIVDRIVEGAYFIDLGDVNVRRMVSSMKG